MAWIARLLIPRRRKNQQELTRRAAEVIAQVMFDIGIDRFLNGTLLVDHALRVRFVSCPSAVRSAHAAVRTETLAAALALRGGHEDSALAAQPRQHQVLQLAEEAMAALLEQSPVLRALPAQRKADAQQAVPRIRSA